MLLFAANSSAQIPATSPFEVGFFIVDSDGNVTHFEYSASYCGDVLTETLSGELEWARDYGYDADGDGIPDPEFPDSLNCGETQPMIGKMALVRRGGCLLTQKVENAESAGAIGVIICDNNPADDLIFFDCIDSTDFSVPAIFVSYEDCELIRMGVDNGESIQATFEVYPFTKPQGPYAFGTPVNHIRPLEDIQVNLVNSSDSVPLLNTNFKIEITDPNGVVSILNETVESIAPFENYTVQFEAYFPEAIGDYTMLYTNSSTLDTLERTFKITEGIWQMDNGQVENWVAPTDNFLIDINYDIGNVYLTGPNPNLDFAVGATFMLENAAELYTGNASADLFQIRLYDLDPDGDGVGLVGTETNYSTFDVVATADYSLTGSEAPYEPIYVVFDEFVQMKANGQYLLMVQYDGSLANIDIFPHYAYGGYEDYPNFSTVVHIDQLYLGGWFDQNRAVVRLHVDDTIGANEEETLDPYKVGVFPNPANDYLNLKLNLDELAEEVLVEIVDNKGKLVLIKTIQDVKKGMNQLDVSNLLNGIYLMTVYTPEGIRSLKFAITQ